MLETIVRLKKIGTQLIQLSHLTAEVVTKDSFVGMEKESIITEFKTFPFSAFYVTNSRALLHTKFHAHYSSMLTTKKKKKGTSSLNDVAIKHH